ncbi:MAG: hypothetical protein H0W89_07235 [Candidatus Levybacteria bacterium]|nr:hypothetical protein [Candidatus Levybacteria bacterium]
MFEKYSLGDDPSINYHVDLESKGVPGYILGEIPPTRGVVTDFSNFFWMTQLNAENVVSGGYSNESLERLHYVLGHVKNYKEYMSDRYFVTDPDTEEITFKGYMLNPQTQEVENQPIITTERRDEIVKAVISTPNARLANDLSRQIQLTRQHPQLSTQITNLLELSFRGQGAIYGPEREKRFRDHFVNSQEPV